MSGTGHKRRDGVLRSVRSGFKHVAGQGVSVSAALMSIVIPRASAESSLTNDVVTFVNSLAGGGATTHRSDPTIPSPCVQLLPAFNLMKRPRSKHKFASSPSRFPLSHTPLTHQWTAWVGIGLLLCACGHTTEPARSPSYRQGYDFMTTSSRQIIAQVKGEGLDDSPAKLFGPDGRGISQMCDSYLQAMFEGAGVGARPQPPTDFSSADYLQGCNDAGRAMLATG
jgi:hypothetical protein